MFGKERSRKVHQIRNNLIVPSGPVTGKLKAVAGLVLALRLAIFVLFRNVRHTGGIAVILGLRTVADYEYLHIFKQSASGPETFPVVAPYLVESLLDVYTSAFQFHVYQRQSVYQNSYVVTVFMATTFGHILVDNL
ncbi:uncharacterized protein BN461_02138 [Bacteroides sp. CAG:1076]|nr:uncharacterized protein BN461_02138 [Bacteroides sp. CAG:1076]